ILKRGTENATLYELKTNETFKNINDKLLANNNVSDAVKKAIHDKTHDYYAFSYYSDGLKIKGYISIPLTAKDAVPVIILLRGGNRFFGLPIPAELSTHPGYSVISTTYRGGVSQGKDEFGGKDVDDVINLFDHLPILEKDLHIKFHEKNKYMLGLSRGGMQLFLSLNRYPELQKKISKVASISGLLNLEQAIQDRADFKDMLVEEFGLTNDEAGKKWIHYRNPVDNISQISRRLPILIAQGTQDTRVCLKEGLDMLLALRNNGHAVTYVEIEGGDHVLSNTPDFKEVLFNWLESDSKK
ncbi:MAG: alpha/beta hydrolase family protein, partial [Candidatus Berkiella sp.]